MLGDRYLIVTPKICAPALAERVETMVIMEDVACEEITKKFAWHSIQGPDATKRLGDLCDTPTMDVAAEGDAYLFRYNRTGLGGWDVLTPTNGPLRKKLLKSSEEVSDGAVEVARLEAGIPVYGKDANERTLPPELGPDYESRYVSYNKGCYTGQEVLMRIHSRGHTNKTWVGLAIEGTAEPGDTVSISSREDAGVITSAVDSPKYGYIAGAMMKNEAAIDGLEVTVHGRQGAFGGEVIPMPIMRYA
jgi:folate-binding protein YgfZ